MKKIIIFIVFFTLKYVTISQCNYITDYYQDMYKACYLYSIENDKLSAYNILKKIDERCEMLNTIEYSEMELYFKLCIDFGEYNEAYDIGSRLISKYGYSVRKVISKLGHFISIDSAKLMALREEYKACIDTVLISQLKNIQELDQRYRNFNKGEISIAEKDSLLVLAQWADSINQVLLMEIIISKGFPTITQVGNTNQSLITSAAVFMHIEDTATWAPILLNEIAAGRCPPYILGKMIDRRLASGKGARFLYGIYANIKPEDIYEYEKLDDRRMSIGMAPMKIEKMKLSFLKSTKFN